MATTFYSNEAVDAKPLHSGTVIYADDTCIRLISSELLGGGGGVEIVAPFLLLGSIVPLIWFWFTEGVIDTFSLYPLAVALLVIIVPILLFRYKPNYPIFSRKSQEIYYVKSPRNIIKFNWSEVKAEYRRVSVFTGSAVSKIDTLTLIGTNVYGSKPPQPAVIAFIVTDEENAKEFWSYLQTYMKNGAEGLEKPKYDIVKEGFMLEVKRLTKQAFYDGPMEAIEAVFLPRSKNPIWLRMLILPLIILYIPIAYIFIYPGEVVSAFVRSTRKRAPIPDDILTYVTDNPESWGKEPESS